MMYIALQHCMETCDKSLHQVQNIFAYLVSDDWILLCYKSFF